MSVANPHVRFRYEDYKSLPESMDKRYELLDGDMTMVPAPTTGHQRVADNLLFLLKRFIRRHALGAMFSAPVDVVFGQGREREVVQPDLIFVSHTRKSIVTEEEIQGAPDLVVEVLSKSTEARDRGYKKMLYARYGVREYWIVDPQTERIEIYAPGEAGFDLAGAFDGLALQASTLFPELTAEPGEVFRAE